MATEEFFEALPQNELLPWELALREALLGALGPNDGSRRVVPLVEWIDRRIGGEIESRFSGDVLEILLRGEEPEEAEAAAPPTAQPPRQQRAAAGAGAEAVKRQAKDAFFTQLPNDKFLPWEENLRMAILRFLAEWPSQNLSTIHDIANGPEVREITKRAIPTHATLKDWVERRIGQEVEVLTDQGDVVQISAEARQIVSTLHAKRAWPGAQAPPAQAAQRPLHSRAPVAPVRLPAAAANAGQDKESFFQGLPGDELTQAELNLRQTLIDLVAKRGRTQTLLVDLATDKEVQRLKGALLPTKVTLREWIERRIGGEVECRKLDGGKIEVLLKTNGSRGSGSQAAAAPRAELGEAAREDKKEAFFASLPGDEFSPAEEAMREALLGFLNSWTKPEPATLSEAGPTPAVASAKKSLLGSSGVSMKEWIDRRIGGEVETGMDAKGQVAFARRGELPPAKRRKT